GGARRKRGEPAVAARAARRPACWPARPAPRVAARAAHGTPGAGTARPRCGRRARGRPVSCYLRPRGGVLERVTPGALPVVLPSPFHGVSCASTCLRSPTTTMVIFFGSR